MSGRSGWMYFSTSCWMHSRLNCFRRSFLNFLVKRSRFVIKSLPIYSILSKIESLIHACSFAAEFSLFLHNITLEDLYTCTTFVLSNVVAYSDVALVNTKVTKAYRKLCILWSCHLWTVTGWNCKTFCMYSKVFAYSGLTLCAYWLLTNMTRPLLVKLK